MLGRFWLFVVFLVLLPHLIGICLRNLTTGFGFYFLLRAHRFCCLDILFASAVFCCTVSGLWFCFRKQNLIYFFTPDSGILQILLSDFG